MKIQVVDASEKGCSRRLCHKSGSACIWFTRANYSLRSQVQQNVTMQKVPVDEMIAVESVGRLTFEINRINNNEMCVKNCESDIM